MSLARKDFMRTTAAALAPFILASGLALNSGDAQALEYGCRTKDEIPTLKTQMTAEGQVPVIRFYQAGRPDPISGKDNWREVLFTMNVQTHDGYRLQRVDNGGICVSSKLEGIRLYNNNTLSPQALLHAPGADKLGSGVNLVVYGRHKEYGQNPMFRAREIDPDLHLDKVTYVVANPKTGEGALLSASHQGELLDKYSKAVPSPSTAGVDHGAEYTQTGKLLVDNQQLIGPVASLK